MLGKEEMLYAMMCGVIPKGMCPLLPYYGGVVVNVEYMNKTITPEKRSIFKDTFHQYIGCLWNALFENEKLSAMISARPVVAIGHDVEKKTWIEDLEEVFLKKVPSFYSKLELSDEMKDEIQRYYKNR